MIAALTQFPSGLEALRATPTGVSGDAQRICSLLGDVASHWIESATGQARIADPVISLYRLHEQCREENWDGENAQAISLGTVAEAQKLITLLPGSIPAPELLPEPTGSIALEWYQRRDHVYVLSVYGKKTLEFAGLFGQGNEIHGRVNFEDSLPPIVQDHLRWFFAR